MFVFGVVSVPSRPDPSRSPNFQASIVPSPILDHINFVDTPGILAADRHGARGYPFPEVRTVDALRSCKYTRKIETWGVGTECRDVPPRLYPAGCDLLEVFWPRRRRLASSDRATRLGRRWMQGPRCFFF